MLGHKYRKQVKEGPGLAATGELRIVAESPDGMVRVEMTPTTGIRLAFHPDTAEHHTERTVEPQIEMALFRAVADGARSPGSVAERESAGNRAGRIGVTPWHGAVADRIENLAVRATSPRRHIAVEWTGHDELTVVLSANVLHRLPLDGVAEEINTTLRELTYRRSVAIRKITQDCRRRFERDAAPRPCPVR